MRFSIQISTRRIPAARILALVTLVLLPFPVSIPLALWLTGRRHFPDSPELPPPPQDKIS